MTSTQVVEASVTTNNSSPQNYTKPADQPTTNIHSIDLVNLSLFIGSFNTDNSFDSDLARLRLTQQLIHCSLMHVDIIKPVESPGKLNATVTNFLETCFKIKGTGFGLL